MLTEEAATRAPRAHVVDAVGRWRARAWLLKERRWPSRDDDGRAAGAARACRAGMRPIYAGRSLALFAAAAAGDDERAGTCKRWRRRRRRRRRRLRRRLPSDAHEWPAYSTASIGSNSSARARARAHVCTLFDNRRCRSRPCLAALVD